MYQTDTKALREELAQALRRKFDDSHGIAVYGAGDTAERWFASFLEGDVVPTCFIDDTPGKAGTLFLRQAGNHTERSPGNVQIVFDSALQLPSRDQRKNGGFPGKESH